MTAFRMELRRNRSTLAWLSLVVGVYAGVMGLMYPILVSNDALMQQYLQTFPKEFLAAFGMSGLLSDPGVFFTTYISSWLWPIVAAIGGLLIGTRAVAGDLERGFLDLPLSTPVSRSRYLGASICGQILVMAVLAIVTVLALWLAGALVGARFDLGRFGLAGVLAFGFGSAIAAAATLAAVVTLNRGRSAGIVGGGLIMMYLVFVVGQLATDWSWIGPVSAWNHFPTTKVIDEGVFPAGDLALFAVIALVCWAGAIAAFRRRDLAA